MLVVQMGWIDTMAGSRLSRFVSWYTTCNQLLIYSGAGRLLWWSNSATAPIVLHLIEPKATFLFLPYRARHADPACVDVRESARGQLARCCEYLYL